MKKDFMAYHGKKDALSTLSLRSLYALSTLSLRSLYALSTLSLRSLYVVMLDNDDEDDPIDQVIHPISPPCPSEEVLGDLFYGVANRTCIAIQFKKYTKPSQSIFQPLGVFPSQHAFEMYFKHRERGLISAVCKGWRCIGYSESDFCSSVRNCFVFYVPLYSTATVIFALKSKLCHAINIEANYFL
jgi:hypothetical protein